MTTPQQNASPGVYVTDDVGLEITDGSVSRVQLGLLPTGGAGTYGLRVVTAAGAFVIIDGTSDIFKIGATGTVTIVSGPANGTNVTGFLDNISPGIGSWPSNFPANNWFTSGQILPYITFTLATGVMAQIQEGFTGAGTNPGTIKASWRWGSFNAGVGGVSGTNRFYVFSEVTL
jgi:hypothetical protein